MKNLSTLLFGIFITFSTVSWAQQSNTEGLFLNVSGESVTQSSDLSYNFLGRDYVVFDDDRGGGLNLKAGYGFSPLFTLYLGYSLSGMERNGADVNPLSDEDEKYALSFFELGGRFTFRDESKKFRPHADITIGGVASVVDDDPETSASGGAISLGGGAQYFLSSVFALDASLMLSPGNYSDVKFFNEDARVNNDKGFFATRFSLGLTVYPFE